MARKVRSSTGTAKSLKRSIFRLPQSPPIPPRLSAAVVSKPRSRKSIPPPARSPYLPQARVQKLRHPVITLAFFILAIALPLAGFWLLSSSGLVANRFKPRLETELSRALNRQVKIRHLEGGIFDRVILRQVEIATPAEPNTLPIQIERVVVQYSLWDILIRKRSLAASLHHIQFIHPIILFDRLENGSWRGPSLAAWPWHQPLAGPGAPSFTLPPIKVSLLSGEISVHQGDKTSQIRNLRGLINLKDTAAVRLYFSGNTDRQHWKNLKVSGLLDLQQRFFRIGLNASRVDLPAWEQVVLSTNFFKIPAGQADLQLEFISRTPQSRDLIPGVGIKGKLVLYDLAITTPLLPQPIKSIYGVVNLNDRELTLKSMQAMLGKVRWDAHGRIMDLQRPYLNIKVMCEQLELADLTELFPRLSQLPTQGQGQATILLKGLVPDITVTGNFLLPRGKIGNLDIRKMEFITRYHQNQLHLLMARGILARGWLEGRGRLLFSNQVDSSPQLNFQVLIKDLALDDMNDLLGGKQLSGRLDGELEINGPINAPRFVGKMSSASLRIAGQNFKNIKGDLTYNFSDLEFRLKTDFAALPDTLLKIRAQRQGEQWHFHEISLSKDQKIYLLAGGDLVDTARLIFAGQLRIRNLPWPMFAFLFSPFKHWNGYLNLDGSLYGSWLAPYFRGRFFSSALVSDPGAQMDAQGWVSITPERIDLSAVQLDQKRIQLQGTLGLRSPWNLQGTLQLNQVQMNHIFIFMLGGWPPGKSARGLIRGRINFGGSLKQLECQGQLAWHKLQWGNLFADTAALRFSSSGKRIWIKEMELVQPEGKFNAVIETELGQPLGKFQILAWMDRFVIGKRHWTADLKVLGSYQGSTSSPNYSAQIQLNNLQVDDKALPALEGTLLWQGKNIYLRALNWGPDLTGAVEMHWTPTWSGKAQLFFNQFSLRSWQTLFDIPSTPLAMPLNGKVDLEWKHQQLSGGVHLESGEQKLTGNLQLEWPAWKNISAAKGQIELYKVSTPLLFQLLRLAEAEKSPQGALSGQISLVIEKQKLQSASGDLEFSNFNLGHWHFKRLATAWSMDPTIFHLKSLEGLQPGGSLKALSGSMRRMPDGTRQVHLELLADNFDFFSRRFHGHFNLEGLLRWEPQWDLQLQVLSPDFGLNRYTFGDFRAGLHYQGQKLSIRTPADRPYQIRGDLILPPDGSVEFQRLQISDQKRHYVDALGRIAGGESDFTVKIQDIPADVLARSLGWPQPWTGITSGWLHYTDPEHISHFEIRVKIENGSVLNLPFDLCSGMLLIDHDWLYFKGAQNACVLERQGKYTMYLSGKIPLPQSAQAAETLRNAEMDVRLLMPEGDLAYLTFIPYFASASGRSSLDLRIQGTMDYPTLSGRATINRGEILPRLYTPQIVDIFADLQFKENEVYLQRLEGKIGEGKLRITAGPQAPWACIFRQLQPHQLNLRLETPEGRIRLDTTKDYEFISAWLKLQALLTGTFETPELGGALEFSDGQFTFPAKPLTEVLKSHQGTDMTFQDLKLTSRKNIWYYNDFVRAQIAPEQSAVFNGGKQDFWGEGRIVVSKGSFNYLDADFSLDPNDETVLIFQGKEKAQLLVAAKTVIHNVRIQNEGRNRDATIYLKVNGELGALKIKLSSDPEMTQAQIMSLLTLGEDFSNLSQEEIDQKIQVAGVRALGRLAGNLLGREIEKSIKKITPLDVIDIRLGGMEKLADSIMAGSSNTLPASASGAEVNGTSLLQDTQIDVGKYLTDELFLNYRGILKERTAEQGSLAWQSFLGLEYNIDPSRRIKVYKNFDADSDQELFWGIEGRVQFEGWQPDKMDKGKKSLSPNSLTPVPSPTPLRH